jgi:1-pyrroline-5-carboxylate dehydrogenase
VSIESKLEKPDHEMDRIALYTPGSSERAKLEEELENMRSRTEEIPLIIDGEEVRTGQFYEVRCPHDHQRVMAKAHLAGEAELEQAVESAVQAQQDWASLDGFQRAAVFNRAADLLSGPRRIESIATIMVNLSKTPFEAELDLAELVDFWRFNAYFMQFLYQQQPDRGPEDLNRLDWRPLEGFVLAIPPFNFFAIGGNLPTAPALVGNVVLWKPASSVILSNFKIMQMLLEAGLPDGVVQFVPFRAPQGDCLLSHPALAGLHFTGSYETLVHLWQQIGQNLSCYRSFPRIVGETGGKDFVVVHPSADIEAVVSSTIRGAFEYQGQKCSAASRMYVPATLWEGIKSRFVEELPKIKMGPVEDLDVFMGAMITEEAFRKAITYLDHARENSDAYEIISGGQHDDARGWFVNPTIVASRDPRGKLMKEEIFGPVLTVYVYPDDEYEATLRLCDESTPFALTGSIFATDRAAIETAEQLLRNAAGNFYINDKPTGAVVSRQPFGGARHSGTNDKAGFWLNLVRWLSPRAIKETLVPSKSWTRPYMR